MYTTFRHRIVFSLFLFSRKEYFVGLNAWPKSLSETRHSHTLKSSISQFNQNCQMSSALRTLETNITTCNALSKWRTSLQIHHVKVNTHIVIYTGTRTISPAYLLSPSMLFHHINNIYTLISNFHHKQPRIFKRVTDRLKHA